MSIIFHIITLVIPSQVTNVYLITRVQNLELIPHWLSVIRCHQLLLRNVPSIRQCPAICIATILPRVAKNPQIGSCSLHFRFRFSKNLFSAQDPESSFQKLNQSMLFADENSPNNSIAQRMKSSLLEARPWSSLRSHLSTSGSERVLQPSMPTLSAPRAKETTTHLNNLEMEGDKERPQNAVTEAWEREVFKPCRKRLVSSARNRLRNIRTKCPLSHLTTCDADDDSFHRGTGLQCMRGKCKKAAPTFIDKASPRKGRGR